MTTSAEPMRCETPPPEYSTVVDLQLPPPSYYSLWTCSQSSHTGGNANHIPVQEGRATC